ncbi:MAG TPA: DUF5947 family protein [Blastocatellia bacterium]|jgi:hypothetical protein
MNSTRSSKFNDSFAALRRFIAKRSPLEICEMCSAPLATDHQHLIEPSVRKLICACDACAILFGNRGETKYRRVPRRILSLPDFRMTDAQWDSLMIPIRLAFFFNSTADSRVIALYPSPAGPTESLLGLESWQEIVRDNPLLESMEPDVEALLVNRAGKDRPQSEYYLAPIDECYKLVGLIRAHWRGLSGGAAVWEEIDRFFADLKRRSTAIREASDA